MSGLPAQERVALTGIVSDSAQSPLFGATVAVVGTELSATTDPDGFFRISGIERAPQALALSHTGFVRRVFRLDLTDARGSTVDVGVLVLRSAVGDVWISGIVTDSTTGDPIPAAIIVVDSMARGVTDMSGYFEARGIPREARLLEIRRIGYTQAGYNLWLGGRDSLTVEVRLNRLPVRLAEIVVVDRDRTFTTFNRDLQGFYRRRESGLGDYITEFDIEKRNPSHLSQMLVGMPGVVVGGDGSIGFSTMRGCRRPTIYINGIPMFGGTLDQFVRPGDVAGVEVYRRSVQAPMRFSFGGAGCAIVVWTK